MNIVIDIETFSSRPGAAIASIGAIAWEKDYEDVFYRVIADDYDGHYSPETIRWHLSLGVGLASVGPPEEAEPFGLVLKSFSDFMQRNKAKERNGNAAAIWTHATFDMPILRDAYFREGWSSVPWNYANCRDLRTLYQLAGGRPLVEETGYTGNHNALEDCYAQKKEVEICLGRLGFST